MSLPPSRAERRFERQITKSCPFDNIHHNMHVHVRLTPQCPQTTSCSQHEGRLQTMIEKPSNEALQLHACVIIHTHISKKSWQSATASREDAGGLLRPSRMRGEGGWEATPISVLWSSQKTKWARREFPLAKRFQRIPR